MRDSDENRFIEAELNEDVLTVALRPWGWSNYSRSILEKKIELYTHEFELIKFGDEVEWESMHGFKHDGNQFYLLSYQRVAGDKLQDQKQMDEMQQGLPPGSLQRPDRHLMLVVESNTLNGLGGGTFRLRPTWFRAWRCVVRAFKRDSTLLFPKPDPPETSADARWKFHPDEFAPVSDSPILQKKLIHTLELWLNRLDLHSAEVRNARLLVMLTTIAPHFSHGHIHQQALDFPSGK